jgi:hypothetical protein
MKMGKSLFLSCVFAVLALPLFAFVGVASAQNILVNPGFETGDTTGWQVLGGNSVALTTVQSPDNGPSLGGMNNAYMSNMGEAIGLTLKQTTPVGSATAGTVYYSFDLKLDQAEVGGVLFVQIFAEQEGVGIVGGSGLMGPYWPWNEWAQFGGSFEAPVGTNFLTIQIMANTGAAVGTNCLAHVDNVYLSQDGQIVDTELGSWDDVKAMFR